MKELTVLIKLTYLHFRLPTMKVQNLLWNQLKIDFQQGVINVSILITYPKNVSWYFAMKPSHFTLHLEAPRLWTIGLSILMLNHVTFRIWDLIQKSIRDFSKGLNIE